MCWQVWYGDTLMPWRSRGSPRQLCSIDCAYWMLCQSLSFCDQLVTPGPNAVMLI